MYFLPTSFLWLYCTICYVLKCTYFLFLSCLEDLTMWPPVPDIVGCKESLCSVSTLLIKWEWALVLVMAPLMTHHPGIDLPPFVFTSIFGLTLISSPLKPICQPPYQIFSFSAKPSCQVSLPLTFSKSPFKTIILVFFLKVVSVLTAT